MSRLAKVLLALVALASASAGAAPPASLPGFPAFTPPQPPFTPADLEKVSRCLQNLGSPKAKDGKEYTSLLIQDTGGFLKDSAAEVMATLQQEAAALVNDVGRSDPSKLEPLIKSAMARLETQYQRVPPVKCLMPVLAPILHELTPLLIQSSKLLQAKLEETWQANVEPKLGEIIGQALEQLIATAVGGEDAKKVLLQAVTAHLLDLGKVEETAAKVAAFSSAARAKSGEAQAAYDAVVPLVRPAGIDRARLAFQVVVEVAQVKGEQFINRGCPSAAGGASDASLLGSPGAWVNQKTLGKLEASTPGLSCLIDLVLKQVEHGIDTVHSAADGSCALVPYGGAPVCTSAMWVMQFAAKYAALVVTKALALQLAQTVREATIYLAAEELRGQLEARGVFKRVNRAIDHPPAFNTRNANVNKALRMARPLAKKIGPAIDKAMRRYLDGDARQYLDIIEAYNGGVRDLVDATAKKAGVTTAVR